MVLYHARERAVSRLRRRRGSVRLGCAEGPQARLVRKGPSATERPLPRVQGARRRVLETVPGEA